MLRFNRITEILILTMLVHSNLRVCTKDQKRLPFVVRLLLLHYALTKTQYYNSLVILCDIIAFV